MTSTLKIHVDIHKVEKGIAWATHCDKEKVAGIGKGEAYKAAVDVQFFKDMDWNPDSFEYDEVEQLIREKAAELFPELLN